MCKCVCVGTRVSEKDGGGCLLLRSPLCVQPEHSPPSTFVMLPGKLQPRLDASAGLFHICGYTGPHSWRETPANLPQVKLRASPFHLPRMPPPGPWFTTRTLAPNKAHHAAVHPHLSCIFSFSPSTGSFPSASKLVTNGSLCKTKQTKITTTEKLPSSPHSTSATICFFREKKITQKSCPDSSNSVSLILP